MDDRKKLMARCYQEANARLRKLYDDEFHRILADIYQEQGVDVQKRRSHIQAKKDQIADAVAWLERKSV
jgi:hypothetical protein